MGEIEALYRKVYFAKSMDQILKETILIMLRQMIIGGGGTVPDLSNYPTKSEMELFVGDAVSTKVGVVDFNNQIGQINSNLNGKVNTSEFASTVDAINIDLDKKLETVDLTPLKNDLSILSGSVATKIDSSALTPINDKITTLSGTVNTKIDASALTPLKNDLTTLSGTVNTKVSTDTFNGSIANLDGKINRKVDTSTFSSEVDTINIELGKKLVTEDLSPINDKVVTLSGTVAKKVDTTTFNNQITVTNNKISTDISTAQRNILSEVNRDYLSRAEYADLGIKLFDVDKGLDTKDFKIFVKTVTTIEAGIWECDFSDAEFKYPPQVFVTAHALNKDETAGDTAFATITPSTLTETYVRGRLSSASSSGRINVSADGNVTVFAMGQ